MSWPKSEPKPSVVYRVYDEHNCLLYVGCTSDMKNRFANHRQTEQPWLAFATHTEVVGPFPRRQALDIEDEAMRTEAPYFNCTPDQKWDLMRNATRARDLLHDEGLRQYVHCIHGGRPACRLATQRWDVELAATKEAIRDDYPIVTAADRLAAYLTTHATEAAS